MAQVTPLYTVYGKNPDVKMVVFSGWNLPLHFGRGILYEHHVVRSEVGMFDVSHMGEFEVRGPESCEFLHYLLTNNIDALKVGRSLYALMCNNEGGTIDDLLVYRLEENRYMLVVNAGNYETDLAWIRMQAREKQFRGIEILDRTAETALIALQGPKAPEILSTVTENTEDVSQLRRFRFKDQFEVAGVPCLISRTGYTGEDGFELYVPVGDADRVWRFFLDLGVSQCGLGARDTLRFEACLPLYGHELRSDITPIEAGLQFAVKLEKGDFIGREVLSNENENGPQRMIVGIEMAERGVPRQGYAVLREGITVGEVTSGMKAPSLDAFLALALVDRSAIGVGDSVGIEISGRVRKARVIETPFYRNT
jgi:aminomethyltransferase